MNKIIKEHPLQYKELRNAIHDILFKFYDREIEVAQGGEFDFEWMEFRTDEILQLILRQGGTYG